MGAKYKEYVFEFDSDHGRQVKLIEIRIIDRIPRSNFKRNDGTWETFKTYPIPGHVRWSKIRLIERDDLTFGSGRISPGSYDHTYNPGVYTQAGDPI